MRKRPARTYFARSAYAQACLSSDNRQFQTNKMMARFMFILFCSYCLFIASVLTSAESQVFLLAQKRISWIQCEYPVRLESMFHFYYSTVWIRFPRWRSCDRSDFRKVVINEILSRRDMCLTEVSTRVEISWVFVGCVLAHEQKAFSDQVDALIMPNVFKLADVSH